MSTADINASLSKQASGAPATPASKPVASAFVGGREVSAKILYVGNLHGSITEEQLYEIFNIDNDLKSIKALHDKNKPGFNYAFVEYNSPETASKAKKELSEKNINNSVIKINWAYHSSNANTVQSLQPVFNIFVGDLAADIDDERLTQIFSTFSSLKEAHVMWDMQTSRSRGYGFVTFLNQNDAEMALKSMNGEVFNGRAIRCNWASHKQANQKAQKKSSKPQALPRNLHPAYGMPGQSGDGGIQQHGERSLANGKASFGNLVHQQSPNMASMGDEGRRMSNQFAMMSQQQQFAPAAYMNSEQSPSQVFSTNLRASAQTESQALQTPQQTILAQGQPIGTELNVPMATQAYEIVLRQAPTWQTTVYLGNIAHFTQETDIIPLLQNFGYIVEFKMYPEKGCAFVRFDSHERAAFAIVQLAGININGRPLRCGWGKEKSQVYRQQQSYK